MSPNGKGNSACQDGRKHRQGQQKPQGYQTEFPPDVGWVIQKRAVDGNGCACGEGQIPEGLSGILQLIENGLSQRKQVVQRPVKHQSGRRSVEEEQKEESEEE